MNVYYNKRNYNSLSDNKNIPKNSIYNEIYLKQKKAKETQMEEKINIIGEDIKQKISEGKDPQKIKVNEIKDIDIIIEFILNKSSRKINDLLILRQFLMSFSNLLEILSLKDNFNDTNELIYKISTFLKKEEVPKNEILFLNGQLGKTFFIILKGEVSILIPIPENVKITCTQFYQYLNFLLDHKEYELIRLSFEINEKVIKERNYQNSEEYEKFLGLLNSNLSPNACYDSTDIYEYMKKFEDIINLILEKNRQLEEKKKEKEDEEEEEEEDDDDDVEEKKKKKSNGEDSDNSSNFNDNIKNK